MKKKKRRDIKGENIKHQHKHKCISKYEKKKVIRNEKQINE